MGMNDPSTPSSNQQNDPRAARDTGMADQPTTTTSSSSFWIALAVIVVLALIAVLLIVYVF